MTASTGAQRPTEAPERKVARRALLGARLQRCPNRLALQIGVETVVAVLATDAGGLEAPERRRWIDHTPGVDVDHARMQHRGQAVRAADVACPHTGGQAVLARVRPLGDLLERVIG